MANQNTQLKKLIRNKFENIKKVSVRQDVGTAVGWKNIRVEFNIEMNKKEEQQIKQRIRELAIQNTDVGSFLMDDGRSDSWRAELDIEIDDKADKERIESLRGAR